MTSQTLETPAPTSETPKRRKPVAENMPLMNTLRVLLALGVLLIWEISARVDLVDPFYFSQPTSIFQTASEWLLDGSLWNHMGATLQGTALGLLIGGFLGMTVGYALARSRTASGLFLPYIQVMNALPRVVLAPIFLLWFGIGIWSKVALAVSLVFFVVFFNTYRGLIEVDKVTLNNAKMLGADERQLTVHVLLPSALVWIFSSLHLSVGFSIIGVVVGEFVGASRGVGYLIAREQGVFNTSGVFAGIAVLIVLVLVIEVFVTLVERRVLSWKE